MDDLWVGADQRVMVADYNATAKADHITATSLHPAYRLQANVYQFLIVRQWLEVSDRARFDYANGRKTADGLHDVLRFYARLMSYRSDRSWVAEAFCAAAERVAEFHHFHVSAETSSDARASVLALVRSIHRPFRQVMTRTSRNARGSRASCAAARKPAPPAG